MARGGFSTVMGKWVGCGILLGGLISGAQSTDCMTRLSGGGREGKRGWTRRRRGRG